MQRTLSSQRNLEKTKPGDTTLPGLKPAAKLRRSEQCGPASGPRHRAGGPGTTPHGRGQRTLTGSVEATRRGGDRLSGKRRRDNWTPARRRTHSKPYRTPHARTNSEGPGDVNLRLKALTGKRSLHTLGFGDGPLEVTPRTRAPERGKRGKLGSVKIQNVCASRDTIDRGSKAPAIRASDAGLASPRTKPPRGPRRPQGEASSRTGRGRRQTPL